MFPPLSLLDLAPIVKGGDAAAALRNTRDLAQHAERWGYHRFWLAEHHNMPGIASAATSVVISHVAAATSTIRVGAGGIMLPNHAPLIVAEQFGTLEALYPGRIDLGLGRAPGTDMATARALRRDLANRADSFPDDVLELLSYFGNAPPGQRVRAIPGAGLDVPVWIFGLESLWRPGRRPLRAPLRIRFPLCAGRSRSGIANVPPAVSPIRAVAAAPRHAGAKRVCRRDRSRRGAPSHLASTSIPRAP